MREGTPGLPVDRLRAAVACLVLTALVFAQDSGRLVADTKLDLTVAPARLMARALHLWDPLGGAGQTQNQGYGYLFPVGPFFWLFQHLGLPDWAVQRLWQSLVLCVAMLGVRALAARMGIGSPGTRLLAGFAYALAARPVSQVGAISIEVWPYALAPWVLVPLVTGVRGGSPRRAAALSGLAVLLVGGVNAAATLAVVPLGALWLVIQDPGPRRRRLASWWAAAVLAATAWWLGPLLLLGRYSPPFLDVIESASTTTHQNGMWAALTGNDLWLQYLSIGGPARPAGYLLVTSAALVVCVTAVWVLGVVGLLDRRTPHRRFLVGGLLVGLVVVTAGHTGALTGPLAGWERALLDGALAPFRNVHKFDLLLRLPLALGLAAAADQVRSSSRAAVQVRRPVALLAALAVLGAASPALRSLEPGDTFAEVPGYWKDVAAWLDRAEPGPAAPRAMVVPASHTGDYAWGHTSDEPLQPLAHSPWAVRDAVPLGGPGVTRVLDAVEEVLRSGRGSPALAPFLARSGTRFLVVRNDLDLRATGSTRPFVVHAALGSSPGLRRVASFGPVVGPGFATGSTVYDAQLGAVYPAVEVFEVDPALAGGERAVTTWPVQGTRRVTGGPESVLALLEAGVLDPRQAVRLAGERDGRREPEDVPTLTDGYRDREVDVGRATDGASATLGAGSERRLSRPVADYLPLPVAGNRARATLRGITWVSASSSAADADAFVLRGRDHNPSAAFDGQADTVWVSGGLVPVSQWVEARFPPTELAAVRVTAPPVVGIAARATRIRVTTDRSSTEVALVDGSATVPLDGVTGRVRLTVTAVAGGSELGVTALEGVLVSPSGPLLAERGLRLARPASGAAADLVLTAGRRDRPGCLVLGDRPVCAATLPQGDEDDVAVDATALLPAAGSYDLAVRGRARGGAALDALLQQGQPITATASSAVVVDPGARAAAVLDRDLRTSWIASPLDPAPTLHLRLAVPHRITGVTVVVDPELAASRPRAVALSVDGAPPTTVALDLRGVARIPAVTGRDVTITFPEVEPRWSRDIDGFIDLLPVGVTELRVNGPPTDLRQSLDPQHRLEQACGQGPALTLDGGTVATTRVTATVGDLLAGRDVSVVPCTSVPVTAAAGEHRFRMARTALVQVTGVTLTEEGRSTGAPSTARVSGVVTWSGHRRLLDVAPGQESYLAVHEAFNTGWVARLDGRKLAAVRLDGWQQGFVLPETGGRVELTYQPDLLYRAALVAGAVLALLLVALALMPARALSAEPRRRRRDRLGPVLGLLVLPLVGGAAGLLVLLVVALASRWRPALARLLGPAGLVGAGVIVALDPWPGGALVHGPAQALGLVTAACLAVSLWWPNAVGELPVLCSAGAWRAPRQPAARPTPPGC